jgi:predicted DNA binding protein
MCGFYILDPHSSGVISECLVVEFSVTGDDCPLSAASREAGAAVDCDPPQLRRDGTALLRFDAVDPAVGEVLDADERVRYLHAASGGDRTAYRCVSLDPCVVHELTDAGFLVESVRYRDGTERHVGAVVGYDVLEDVLAAAGDAVGVAIERVYELGAEGDDAAARGWDLTPAQEAALRTALELGYFAVPRDADAGDVAAELGISKSAFLERLRRGQASLFRQVFG